MTDVNSKPSDAERRFFEEFGMAFETVGLTPMAGRIMGWLLICEPPQQSMDELAEALDASKGSISTSLQLLRRFGWVEPAAVPGERKNFYRLRSDVWTRTLEFELQMGTRFRQLAEQGLEMIGNEASASQRERLQSMQRLFSFFERELADLIDRWQHQREGE